MSYSLLLTYLLTYLFMRAFFEFTIRSRYSPIKNKNENKPQVLVLPSNNKPNKTKPSSSPSSPSPSPSTGPSPLPSSHTKPKHSAGGLLRQNNRDLPYRPISTKRDPRRKPPVSKPLIQKKPAAGTTLQKPKKFTHMPLNSLMLGLSTNGNNHHFQNTSAVTNTLNNLVKHQNNLNVYRKQQNEKSLSPGQDKETNVNASNNPLSKDIIDLLEPTELEISRLENIFRQ